MIGKFLHINITCFKEFHKKTVFLQNPVDLDRFWLTDNVHDLWYTEGEWGHVFGSGLNDLLI